MPTEATYVRRKLDEMGYTQWELNPIHFCSLRFEDTAHTWLRFAIVESQEDH